MSAFLLDICRTVIGSLLSASALTGGVYFWRNCAAKWKLKRLAARLDGNPSDAEARQQLRCFRSAFPSETNIIGKPRLEVVSLLDSLSKEIDRLDKMSDLESPATFGQRIDENAELVRVFGVPPTATGSIRALSTQAKELSQRFFVLELL